MPNQNTKSISENLPKYDSGDMHDLALLAECDMQWMTTAIGHIRREIKRLNGLAESGERLYEFHFTDLIHHVDMYEFLADTRLAHHTKEAERLEKEWEQIKGGRNA